MTKIQMTLPEKYNVQDMINPLLKYDKSRANLLEYIFKTRFKDITNNIKEEEEKQVEGKS